MWIVKDKLIIDLFYYCKVGVSCLPFEPLKSVIFYNNSIYNNKVIEKIIKYQGYNYSFVNRIYFICG